MARMLLLVVLLAVARLAAAGFYQPRPIQCPVRQKIEYEDVVVTVTQINTITSALPIRQVDLNTVTRTSFVTITSVQPTTVVASPQQVAFTDIQIVETTLPLVYTRVSTVTETLVNTQVDIITSTATNYITTFETLFSTLSIFDVIKQGPTQFVDNPSVTLLPGGVATLTTTSSLFQTTNVIVSVPGLAVDGTTTFTSVIKGANTHTLTKRITQTICPPGGTYD